MQPKHRRLVAILTGLVLLGAAAALVLVAFEENIVFFLTPVELAERDIAPGQQLRLGGLVAEGSVVEDGDAWNFTVTDLQASVPVTYTGILPDLFDEGQGVVIEGAFDAGGLFTATTVLAKHDETYMPAEVADALRESGQWQGDDGAVGP